MLNGPTIVKLSHVAIESLKSWKGVLHILLIFRRKLAVAEGGIYQAFHAGMLAQL
jgi:hypothetical protein